MLLEQVSRSAGDIHTRVIFVHGLGGDPWKTWQCRSDTKAFWPRWLAEDLDGVATYVMGYDAPVSGWGRLRALHPIDVAAGALARLFALSELRTGAIIFVCHSLGGLVVKQLLRTAASEAEHRADASDFLARVKKIAFLATPHNGAELATWADRLRILVRPSAATASLVRNDPHLRELNYWYRDCPLSKTVHHLVLVETEPMRILGTIVPIDSGDPGLSSSRPIFIERVDHQAICKPCSRDSDVYVNVKAFVEREHVRAVSAAETKLEEVKTHIDLQSRILLEAIQAEKGIPYSVLIKILHRLGETVVANDPVEIGRLLNAKADEYIVLKQQMRKLASEDPRVEELRVEAFAALERADMDQARAKLRLAVDIDRAATKELAHRASLRALSAVQSLSQSARVSSIAFNYRDAAMDLAEASSLAGPVDRHVAWQLRLMQGTHLFSQGDEFGENQAFVDAIAVYRSALALAPLNVAPGDWAATQFYLGDALRCLGERESGTERLEEALVAYRAAFSQHASVADEAGQIHNGLGNALFRLGQRKKNTKLLEEAATMYRDALSRLRPEDVATRSKYLTNLGNVLDEIGNIEEGTDHLELAVEAHRAALAEVSRTSNPRGWATIQNNLGIALQRLGERRRDAGCLMDAIAAYNEALKEQSPTRVALEWARTQHNLGTAFRALGDADSLERAVQAYCEALSERRRERATKQWAETTGSLVAVMEGLAEVSKRQDLSEETLSVVERGVRMLHAGGVGADFVIDRFDPPIRDRLRMLIMP
ncbi:alpha/beta fold hydrolase [Bradyrhizobium sp. STM 3809]|uniref:alpha/beta fold hydrolase n=1 Tax=Bradyrhizobium sp. STM 3809 TaxID=551936 RepID=UPI000240925D|nr:alpha/beta fold hydrolase [Bradyrhizobium sp. STM 3809]CCE00659.1 putative Tetratricopeptide domain protein [Bradyrhizobium sp. STM 3809]